MKPKLPAQFKAAESNNVPFAVILGEDELAAGQVRVKEMGLPDGHPEKEGILVDITSLVAEIKKGLERKTKEENAPVDEAADIAQKVKDLL